AINSEYNVKQHVSRGLNIAMEEKRAAERVQIKVREPMHFALDGDVECDNAPDLRRVSYISRDVIQVIKSLLEHRQVGDTGNVFEPETPVLAFQQSPENLQGVADAAQACF